MKTIREALEYMSALAQYQKGYLYSIRVELKEPWRKPNETYCCNGARDLLDSVYTACPGSYAHGFGGLVSEFNYDIRAIAPTRTIFDIINSTRIEEAWNNLMGAAILNQIESVDAKTAQERANAGDCVHAISLAWYHEAIVCPDDARYDPARGPLLGQAGKSNGIMYMSDMRSFGWYGTMPEILPKTRFYIYRFR